MEKRITFANILEESRLFTKDQVESLVKESIQEDLSLTDLIEKKGLATLPVLSDLLQQNKFNMLLGELLIESKIVKPSVVREALKEQDHMKGGLGTILEKLGHITHDRLIESLCSQLNIVKIIPEVDLVQSITPALPEKFMRKSMVFPYFVVEESLTMLMVNPFDHELLEHLTKVYKHHNLVVAYIPENEFNFFFDLLSANSESGDQGDGDKYHDVELISEEYEDQEGHNYQIAHSIKVMQLYIKKAIEMRASDIHFEPLEHSLRIRFAISGFLRVITYFPQDFAARLVATVKAASGMDISSHRIPDDGQLALKYKGIRFSLRISTYPCMYGENCVIRILRHDSQIKSIEYLGFSKSNAHRIKNSLLTPTGIILAAGPTGTGKSTTLYTILQQLLTEEKHIITIEDPIEYHLSGATQAAINVKAGFTFEAALPAIMRQNPDVIMVGEVRNKETANAIIRAALTGHKVLSTIHTENATSTLTRLSKMGVENFLIYETIDLVVAQRLVRVTCPKCRRDYVPSESVLSQLKISIDDIYNFSFKKGSGLLGEMKCDVCDGTGYNGLTAIHEVLLLNNAVARAMSEGKSAWEVREVAMQRAGLITMREDCLYKIYKGVTTFEECLRVTPDLDEPMRSLRLIIGLSENRKEFAPCDYIVIPLAEGILKGLAKRRLKALGSIERNLKVEIEKSGVKSKSVNNFKFNEFYKELKPKHKDLLKKYIKEAGHCAGPLDNSPRCKECSQEAKIIINTLEQYAKKLSGIMVVNGYKSSSFFAHRGGDKAQKWSLFFSLPLGSNL